MDAQSARDGKEGRVVMKTMRQKEQRRLTEKGCYRTIAIVLMLQFFAYGNITGPVPARAVEPNPVVTLDPVEVYARQKMSEAVPLTFTFPPFLNLCLKS